MDFRCLKFLVVLVSIERISGFPLAICSYNGTSYGEGQSVRTEDPCLFCVCQKGALECSLRVCADHPNVLPPGCFFVHKPNECCPQLFCEEEESSNPIGIELRTGFTMENTQSGKDCAINGSIYAEGSTVGSTGHCEYCYCIEGEMKCLKPRCLRFFEGCQPIYEKSSCCPTQYDCRNADSDALRAQVKGFVLQSFSKVSDDSSRTLADSKEISNESETVPNLTEKTEDEFRMTTTEETTAVETTKKPEKETTTFFAEDFLTSVGFQTMESEHLSKETTTVSPTEETTLTAETTTEVFSPMEEANQKNLEVAKSSNFSEAVDTSVSSNEESRDNSSQEVDEYDSYDYGEPRLPPSLPNLVIFPFVAADAVVKDETDAAIDVHDKSEIKRIDAHPVFYKDYFSPPIKTEGGFVPKEPFFEFGYFRKEQIESPAIDLNEAVICQDVACPSANFMNLSPLEDKQRTDVSRVNATFETEQPTGFEENQQNKKPVTVTYKNVVVDFYPNYLVTTTRAKPETERPKSSNVATPTEEDGERTTTRTTVHHKYSSRIRGQANASTEKRNEVPSKDLTESEDSSASRQKIYSSTLKHVKKDGIKTFTKTSFNEQPATAASVETTADDSGNAAGTLLKLAGCNIYGMMYRVGKVITELSGPCLECLCTDSGVQCRPLKC